MSGMTPATSHFPHYSISTTTDQVTVEFWAFGDPNAQPRNNFTFNLGNNSGNRVAFTHLPWGDSRIYWDAGTTCCGGPVP